MHLMQLPPEILSAIINHLGPSYLRSDVKYLTLSHQWYSLAQPIFFSGLDLSDIKLAAGSLAKFPPSTTTYSSLLSLMQQTTKSLTLRLLGHWWDEKDSRAFDDYHDEYNDTDDVENLHNVPTVDFTSTIGQVALNKWRDKANLAIKNRLAVALSHFTALQSLRLDFSAEEEVTIGPFWDYIYDTSLVALLSHIREPIRHHQLADLTLDICGTNILVDPNERDHRTPPGYHMCPTVAQVLPTLRKARLRLPNMCHEILSTITTTTDDHSPNPERKLETLILKLHQPFWERRCTSPTLSNSYCTIPCPSGPSSDNPELLHQKLYRAARTAQQHMPRLTMLRISYADVINGGTNISGLDVLKQRRIYVPEEFFIYEDDGTPCWWEECEARITTGGLVGF